MDSFLVSTTKGHITLEKVAEGLKPWIHEAIKEQNGQDNKLAKVMQLLQLLTVKVNTLEN